MPNMAEIKDNLINKGYKLTKNRRILLQGLLEIEKWATAQELFEYVAARNRQVNFSTIYRNLDLLTEMEFVCRVELDNYAYVYTLNHEKDHHHHLICRTCNKIFPLDFCPLNNLDPIDLQNFTDIECKFTVYGCCKDCQTQFGGEDPPDKRW